MYTKCQVIQTNIPLQALPYNKPSIVVPSIVVPSIVVVSLSNTHA